MLEKDPSVEVLVLVHLPQSTVSGGYLEAEHSVVGVVMVETISDQLYSLRTERP